MRKILGVLLLILLLGSGLFLVFGTVETYNDFVGKTVAKEFMGYVTVSADVDGQPVVRAADLPSWFPASEAGEAISAPGCQPGERLGIYGDFVAHEVLYQKRAIVTGSLKDSSTSWYYQLRQAYIADAPTPEPAPSFDHGLIRWAEDGSGQ